MLFGPEYAVALDKQRAVCRERSIEVERVNVYHLHDMITEIWSHDADPYVLDEF